MNHEIAYHETPVGKIEIHIQNDALMSVMFIDHNECSSSPPSIFTQTIIQQIDEYFAGSRMQFSVKLNPVGTSFQKSVWHELLQIPFGETISYLQLAKRLGNEQKVRAVGNANSKNPIAIIVPCHRVIGSDGTLTGYAGGLWRKKFLIDLEKKYSNKNRQLSIF